MTKELSQTDKEKSLYYNLTVGANLLITMPNDAVDKVFAGFPEPIEMLNMIVKSMRDAAELIRSRRSMIDETVRSFQSSQR